MNKMENQASAHAVDSLINFETVKFFNNEGVEARRYNTSLVGYQKAAVETATSLAFLNFGQVSCFLDLSLSSKSTTPLSAPRQGIFTLPRTGLWIRVRGARVRLCAWKQA